MFMVNVESFLTRKNMTKVELCSALGIDPKSSLISAYEKGRSNPSYDMCVKLLGMGMTIEELFGVSIPEKAYEKVTSLKEFVEIFQKSMNETLDSVKKNL